MAVEEGWGWGLGYPWHLVGACPQYGGRARVHLVPRGSPTLEQGLDLGEGFALLFGP